ncbi:hypothetical protein C4K26_5986 [Pseudomonas chlororaphis]|nr:hypothetical protein C4K26_5986 [Pseudomonas chlororaphis]
MRRRAGLNIRGLKRAIGVSQLDPGMLRVPGHSHENLPLPRVRVLLRLEPRQEFLVSVIEPYVGSLASNFGTLVYLRTVDDLFAAVLSQRIRDGH